MSNQNIFTDFIYAIQNKKIVLLKFYSKEDGIVLERTCAPLDYGPSRRAKDKSDRFHLWDFDSDTKNHILSLKPEQIVDMIVLDKDFIPQHIVTWDTVKSPWFVEREWGNVS